MQSIDVSGAVWRKSSRSNHGDTSQTDCVEVAELRDRVEMRDSKDPAGPVLAFTRPQWRAVLGSIRASDVD